MNELINKKTLGRTFRPVKCIMRFFAAWLTVNFIVTFTTETKFTQLAFAQDLDLKFYLLAIFVAFLAISVFDLFLPAFSVDGACLFISMLLYSVRTVGIAVNYWYTFFILIVVAAVTWFLISKRYLIFPSGRASKLIDRLLGNEGKKTRRIVGIGVTIFSVSLLSFLFVLVVGSIGAKRYLTYSAPNFDFGIFCNMFYNMKESFLPLVTCERDALMSHFAVHVSPIWYLLLPFYFIFPSPVTLQIGQAAIIASGTIPLYFICRHYKLSKLYTVLFEIAFVCHPALAGGTFYDIHENCFLTPLLLWVFYFYEKRRPVGLFVFVVLTLLVKEDAAIYIAFFALFVVLSNLSAGNKKELILGGASFAVAVAWFVTATTLLATFGDGVMTSSRFGPYMYDPNGGFAGIIKTVILNPGYVFTQFTNSKYLLNKLLYILQMLVPLAFTPFITKKISRYVLLFPMILVNLMPLYVYQYDIGFQYHFGSVVFLFWAAIMNVAEFKPMTRRFAISMCAVASALLMCVTAIPKFNYYNERYEKNSIQYEKMDETLTKIPSDASVTCSTMLLAHLASRPEIYEVAYHDVTKEGAVLTDFVVLDGRYDIIKDTSKYYGLGYKMYLNENGIIILIRGDLLPSSQNPGTSSDDEEEDYNDDEEEYLDEEDIYEDEE